MPPYSISSRLVQGSPSVSVEKGAYRMRAIPSRSPSKLRRASRPAIPSASSVDRQLAILIVFLISATISCFGAAYYLFTTRWETRTITSLPGDLSNDVFWPQVDLLDSDLDSAVLADPRERYLAYLPHSGFHNQRIAFENALVLSRLLNRTLLVPPVRLGNQPVYYHPFDELRDALNNSTKSTLQHCRTLLPEPSSECVNYFDYTFVPWEWLVDLTQIKREQGLLSCLNLSGSWLDKQLHLRANDTLELKDTSRNHYSFLDFAPLASPLSRKYLETVQISTLASRPERLIMLGTLFGSSRLHLRNTHNYSLRKRIRHSMAFTNPLLWEIADKIGLALGGQYLAVHLRLGDGLFLENARDNIRLAWWKLLHFSLGFNVEDALAIERDLFYSDSDAEDFDLKPPHIPIDIPALRAPHPPLPLLKHNTSAISCVGPLHTSPLLQVLNTPLFISTDVMDPRTDPLLWRLMRTFPCAFFLSDFAAYTSTLDSLINGYDGVQLKPFLIPFLDAMIAARAWQVVGTEQSTFSAFVQDVLWRTYHGWEIVQRG